MKILGFGGPFFHHDPAAAIVIDGKIAAAAEEERFVREKHAIVKPCLGSIEFCLKQTGIAPKDIDAVAFSWSFDAYNRKKWKYAARTLLLEPSRAYKAIAKSRKQCAGVKKSVFDILKHFDINLPAEKIFVCGMALKPKLQADAEATRNRLGIANGDRVILIGTGSLGIGFRDKDLEELSKITKLNLLEYRKAY